MTTPRCRPVTFALVGVFGFICQIVTLQLLAWSGMAVPLATGLAVLAAIAHNFLWHRRWTWVDRSAGDRSAWGQWLRFVGLNGIVSLSGNVVITAGLAASGVPLLVANLAAVGVCSVANFVLADRLVFAALVALVIGTGTAEPATLSPKALAAWKVYVDATEQRIEREETNPDAATPSGEQWRTLRAGGVLLSPLMTRQKDGSPVDVPDGSVHHWVGRVFLPGVDLQTLLTELQAPTSPRWRPAEVRSMSVKPDGSGGLRVFMRVERDSLVDVTYDIEHLVRYTRHAGGHATSRSVSRHVVQIDDAGSAAERRLPEGDDLGFLWRLNAYWRYVPVPGGVLVVCESIALSRGVPSVLRPLVAPIIDRVSRESLADTLRALRTGFSRST